ncbi:MULTISPECIES: tellurite resistance TerB family protein [Niastella]|nr:TerB family tellurite resistance protein [Niastella soli]
MDNKHVLEGYSDQEKGAYLGAIASIATADRQASEEELQYLTALCNAADISEPQKDAVIRASSELSGDELKNCLDILKNSDLKFSFVTDLIAFAKSDDNYGEEEQQRVKEISQYLGVDQNQFSLLGEFSEKAAAKDVPAEEKATPSFLSSLGLTEKMKSAGINSNSLLKGLLGIAGPVILGSIVSKILRGRGQGTSGNLGGLMGGGGLGSLIGMLSGGRGFGNAGGLLGRIFGQRI